jgi:hypothetical protein
MSDRTAASIDDVWTNAMQSNMSNSTRRGRTNPELAELFADAGQAQADYEDARAYADDLLAEANVVRLAAFRAVRAGGGSFREIETAIREAGATLDHSRAHQLLRETVSEAEQVMRSRAEAFALEVGAVASLGVTHLDTREELWS